MTEITDLSPTDALNTEVTGESIDGNVANMSSMDDTLQAILGLLARSIRTDTLRFLDNTDDTKRLALDLAGLTTATTRTLAAPDASGTIALTTDIPNNTFGQCRLALDGANIRLSPFNGNILTINGVGYTIPSAGVALAPSGLTDGTLYYIYAYMNSGTMTLEASTTGHSTDTATGIEIETGDATRTLVGMVRPIAGPAFVDSETQRFVVSWFNQKRKNCYAALSAPFATTSTSYVTITGLSVEFLAWAQDVTGVFSGSETNSAGNNTFTVMVFDGSVEAKSTIVNTTISSSQNNASSSYDKLGLSEGYHTFSISGSAATGTSTWRVESSTSLGFMG